MSSVYCETKGRGEGEGIFLSGWVKQYTLSLLDLFVQKVLKFCVSIKILPTGKMVHFDVNADINSSSCEMKEGKKGFI